MGIVKSEKRKKRGSVVIILTITVLILTFSAILVLVNSTFSEYKTAVYEGRTVQAQYYARSGIEASIRLISKVPGEMLYQFGAFDVPFPITLGNSDVIMKLSEESGKINVNRVIHFFDDEPDLLTREYLDSLSYVLGIDSAIWDELTDYVDENSTRMPSGAELPHYQSMDPPRTIKNGRLQDLRELLLLPSFNEKLLYSSLVEKDEVSTDFASDEEELARSQESYILADLLTTYLPTNPDSSDQAKININSAPHAVIRSLHAEMTEDIARKIIIEKIKLGGRFESVEDLKSIPELNTGEENFTLYDKIKDRITVDDTLYKIVAESHVNSQTAHALVVYDRGNNKVVYFLD